MSPLLQFFFYVDQHPDKAKFLVQEVDGYCKGRKSLRTTGLRSPNSDLIDHHEREISSEDLDRQQDSGSSRTSLDTKVHSNLVITTTKDRATMFWSTGKTVPAPMNRSTSLPLILQSLLPSMLKKMVSFPHLVGVAFVVLLRMKRR